MADKPIVRASKTSSANFLVIMKDPITIELLAAIEEALAHPFHDEHLRKVNQLISAFAAKFSHPAVNFYTRSASSHLAQALKYKSQEKREGSLRNVENQIKYHAVDAVRELQEKGKL